MSPASLLSQIPERIVSVSSLHTHQLTCLTHSFNPVINQRYSASFYFALFAPSYQTSVICSPCPLHIFLHYIPIHDNPVIIVVIDHRGNPIYGNTTTDADDFDEYQDLEDENEGRLKVTKQ